MERRGMGRRFLTAVNYGESMESAARLLPAVKNRRSIGFPARLIEDWCYATHVLLQTYRSHGVAVFNRRCLGDGII